MNMPVVTRRTLADDIALGFLDWRAKIGPEQVTNGSFTGDASGWTLGSGWTYNANAVDRDGAGTATMTQAAGAVANTVYKVVFALTAYTDGSVTPSIGGVSGAAVSASGTSTQYIKTTGTGDLTFTPTAGATFTIDNVSVKKVGYVSTDGIVLWVDDRGAAAGKGALHIMTEDGTVHVLGDRIGFGTLNPGASLETLGNLLINIGGYALTLTHAITAARTVTYPDRAITVAGLDFESQVSQLIAAKKREISTATGWTNTGAGTPNGTVPVNNPMYMILRTGAGGDSAILSRTPIFGFNTNAVNNLYIDWREKLYWEFTVARATSNANNISYIQIKENDITRAQLTTRGIGIKIANLVVTGHAYGTELGTTATLVTLTDTQPVTIGIRLTSSGAEFFVNGVSTASITTAGQFPAAIGAAESDIVCSTDNVDTATSVDLAVSECILVQEH